MPHIGKREYRLDAAGAVGDDAEAAGRRYRGPRCIPVVRTACSVVDAAFECGEHASFAGKVLGLVVSGLGQESHHPVGCRQRFFAVIGNAELQQHVGEAHDAQADLPCAPGMLPYHRQRELIHVDDVVQESHGQPHDPGQVLEVDRCRLLRDVHHSRQIDGTEIAGLVG